MIVVIGASHDDILYFEKVLYNRREEVFLNRYVAYIGTVFNQELLVMGDQYGSILSSAVVSHILNINKVIKNKFSLLYKNS